MTQGKDNPYAEIAMTVRPGGSDAQVRLRKALTELLATHSLSDIPVKTLCSAAAVARTTFYYYYDNVDQVLSEVEDDLIYDLIHLNDKLMDRMLISPEDLLFSSATYSFVEENRETFLTLLVRHPDPRFIEKWKVGAKYHLWERLFSQGGAPDNAAFLLEMASALTVSAHTWFLQNPGEGPEREELPKSIASFLQLLQQEYSTGKACTHHLPRVSYD